MVGKSIFTLILLIIALVAVLKIKTFIKNNEPIPTPTTTIVVEEATSTPTITTLTLALHEPFILNGVSMSVEAVTEDSRCPSNVQCIQAGTVKANLLVKTDSASTTSELEIDKPVTIGSLEITLNDVAPYPVSPKQILPGEYSFTLTVKNIK